jgi:hypothetical protein
MALSPHCGVGTPTVWAKSWNHPTLFKAFSPTPKSGGVSDMVNGARVSKAQRRLCEMLDGKLNLPCGRYLIDVATCVDNVNIAAEYDSWS